MSVSFRRDVVILACAISAGVHGALAPQHFAEGAGAGAGFVGATVVLASLAVALTRRPQAGALSVLAAIALGGLIASYALAVTTGLPPLHPEPEPVGAVGLATNGVEAVGVVAAASLFGRRPAVALLNPQAKGI